MKTASRLQFSAAMRAMARGGAWLLLTMTVGLILVILFGSPLAASSSNSPNDLPGTSYEKKPGPWGVTPVRVRV